MFRDVFLSPTHTIKLIKNHYGANVALFLILEEWVRTYLVLMVDPHFSYDDERQTLSSAACSLNRVRCFLRRRIGGIFVATFLRHTVGKSLPTSLKKRWVVNLIL